MGKALRIAVFVAVSIWVIYLFFYRIGSAPFENWDEAFYADGIRYMYRHHQFIVPYWNGVPFFDKPPLYYWFGVVSSWLFGLNEFAIRLPSVLAAIVTIALSGYYAFRKYGKLASLATICAIISNPIYIYRSRGANLDALATLWIVVSFLVLQSSARRRTWYFGLTVGLVYLTKASLAYYLIPIFVVDIIFRNLHLLRQSQTRLQTVISICRHCIICGFSAAILPFLWLSSAYLQQGWPFVQYFLFSSDQGVAHLSIARLSTVYLGYMRDSIGIWFGIAAVVGYVFMMREFVKHRNEITFGTFLLFLLMMSPKQTNNWYLMPLFPFAAIAVGYAVKTVRDRYMRRLHHRYLLVFPLLFCFLLLWQYSRMHRRIIRHILESQTTIYQSKSAGYAKRITHATTPIVRLDDLYPTTIYYSDRKVLISIAGKTEHNDTYITRDELSRRIQNKTLRVVVGKTQDVQSVITSVGYGRIDFTLGDESVGVF